MDGGYIWGVATGLELREVRKGERHKNYLQISSSGHGIEGGAL